MTESLPFDRESASLTPPDWYDFAYFRRLKPAFTPRALVSVLLLAFAIFILFSSIYVSIAASVEKGAGVSFLVVISVVEVLIVAGAIWALAHDFRVRRAERKLTPYGRKFNNWVESDFNPWLRDTFSIYIDPEDAEELILRKSYSHFSFRGESIVKLAYEDGNIVVRRDVLPNPVAHYIVEDLEPAT